jgi:hypothetical protein
MKKEYILQEIKRTAAANASVPLGSRKFESETGIKYHDWFGIHWARWNDAVREAGFAPNQLRVGYQETELLEKYATLARELGRLPAKGDLRLKSSNDSEFPHDITFHRLGTKLELVNKVLLYCRSRSRYEDVARWCETPQSARSSLSYHNLKPSPLRLPFPAPAFCLLSPQFNRSSHRWIALPARRNGRAPGGR